MADLLVVVGVVVVVVVVVAVVLVVLVEGDVALLALEDEEAVCEAAVPALLVPACSFATRRPTRAVDAVAATTADCVIRRRRRRARWRDWGELCPSVSFITSSHSLDDMMKSPRPTRHPTARLAPAVSHNGAYFSQGTISRRTP